MPKYQFGPFTLDSDAYRLTRDGEPIVATPQQLDLLAYLVARPSRLVTREELFQTLWPDVVVTDNALTQLVSELRQTLLDSPSTPAYVQTVARRGYRFIAHVRDGDGSPASTAPPSSSVPQTFNLDVLRAVTEGRLQLEALDSAEIDAAVANFERAIALDPGFAAGFVGLANARFWKYERSRSSFAPDSLLLATAVNDARRGVTLAPDYAEAHATLGYLLAASGRPDEARAAARKAVALQPQNWGHHFRLGHAVWGSERIEALGDCLRLYPAFPFAHFQIAMVHVARGALDVACKVLEEGIAVQQALGAGRSRFPASGLHWMLGSIVLSQHDAERALVEFDAELAAPDGALYSREFSVAALNGRGFALMVLGRLEDATDGFQRSLAVQKEQARAHLGLALVAQQRRRADASDAALRRGREAVQQLRTGGQTIEASLMTAGEQIVRRRYPEAIETLDRLLTDAPQAHAGWDIPIDPLFAPLATVRGFDQIRRRLAARAG